VEGGAVSESKKRKRPARMGVLNSEEHVPVGFVPLSSLKSEDDTKGLSCYITRKCNSGEIDSYCMKAQTGRTVRLYVHVDDIQRIKAEYEGATHQRCSRSAEDDLSYVQDLLGKLADRVEQLHVKIDKLI
jgi:hypothetical protein